MKELKKKKRRAASSGQATFSLSLSLSRSCASGGTPEGRRTASPLACRSLTQRVLVLERGLVSLHHGCCAFVHKDCFPFFFLPRAPKGRYKWGPSAHDSQSLWPRSRLSRGRAGQAHEGPLGRGVAVVVGVASAPSCASRNARSDSPSVLLSPTL